jgi:5-methylcytosine-specific restriction endonuclease McrA
MPDGVEMTPTKTCRRCHEDKHVSSFHKHRRGKYGVDTICKPCQAVKANEYRLQNMEKFRQHAVAYRKRHPDRVKATMSKWLETHDPERGRPARRWADPESREKLLSYKRNRRHKKRANGVASVSAALEREMRKLPCRYCGQPGPNEIDHIVPICRGGQHAESNLAPCCRSCNARKSHFLLSEWEGGRHAVPAV